MPGDARPRRARKTEMISGMSVEGELEMSRTLVTALDKLGVPIDRPTVEMVLAAFLSSLMNRYGLTDSQNLDPSEFDQAPLPDQARAMLDRLLGDSSDRDALRNAIYDVAAELADDVEARRKISSKTTHSGVMLLTQVAWNIEQSPRRPRLPFAAGPISVGGRTVIADIAVPAQERDFATMQWTDRTNMKAVPEKVTGDAFRRRAATLAGLIAARIVERSEPAVGLDSAELVHSPEGRRIALVWSKPHAVSSLDSSGRSERPNGPLLVGAFAEIGGLYQSREFDAEIATLWADGGDRRVWLRGGPGVGKTHAARRVMQESLMDHSDEREELLVWVDSADPVSVTRELARVAQQLPELEIHDKGGDGDTDRRLAYAVLDALRTTAVRWLVVYDGADADQLIEQHLIPSGLNPRGRVLITTLSASHRIASSGRQVNAELFTEPEAADYLIRRLPDSSSADRVALLDYIDPHPLALSIISSTIASNGMTVAGWLDEFRDPGRTIDESADSADAGGYPNLIGRTWKLALSKASEATGDKAVERAAMIVALQDPDGHPTWLWQRDRLLAWIAAPDDRSNAGGQRIHPALKILIDTGIARLIGTWADGRIAVHQLAARAIREQADPDQLRELASVLVDEWVLQTTEDPSRTRAQDLRSNLSPICGLPDLPDAVSDAATALWAYAAPTTSLQLKWMQEDLDIFEPLLPQGGVVGRAELASRVADLGDAEHDMGRDSDAVRTRVRAVELYNSLLDEREIDDRMRAEYTARLAGLEAHLGRHEAAREHRQAAVRMQERLASSSIDQLRLRSALMELADLYRDLAQPEQSEAMLDRAISAFTTNEHNDVDREAQSLAKLARDLATRGRLEEARELTLRAVGMFETTEMGRAVLIRPASRDLALILARLGRWKEAEQWMSDGEGSGVQIASIQLHRGLEKKARRTLAEAAQEAKEAELRPRRPRDTAIELERSGELRAVRQHGRSLNMLKLLEVAVRADRWDDAEKLASIHLQLVQAQEFGDPIERQQNLAAAYGSLGTTLLVLGRSETAINHLRSSVRGHEIVHDFARDDDQKRLNLAETVWHLAVALRRYGETEQAASAAQRAVGLAELQEDERAQRIAGPALNTLRSIAHEQGDVTGELEYASRCSAHWRAAEHRDPGNCDVREELATAISRQSWILLNAGEPEGALVLAEELVAIRQETASLQSAGGESQKLLLGAMLLMGRVYAQKGDADATFTVSKQAVQAGEELIDSDPGEPEHSQLFAVALGSLADALSKLGREDEALAALMRATVVLQLPTELHPVELKPLLLEFLGALESGLREVGRHEEADAASARAADLNLAFPDPGDEWN